jgi:hypothetical protein
LPPGGRQRLSRLVFALFFIIPLALMRDGQLLEFQ